MFSNQSCSSSQSTEGRGEESKKAAPQVDQRDTQRASPNHVDSAQLKAPLTEKRTQLQHKAPVESRASASSDEEKDTTPVISLRLFVENFKESCRHIRANVEKFLRDGNISTTRKVLVVGGTAAMVITSCTLGVSQGFGALGLVLCHLGSKIKENRLVRAQGVVQGGVLSAHFAADNNDALSFTNSSWAARMLAHSVIPESRKVLNLTVAAVGTALSCAMFCSGQLFTPGLTFANSPLIAIVVGGIASSLPSACSWLARVGYVTGSCLMFPYHCAISGSWFLAALSLTSGVGFSKTLIEDDLPTLRKNIAKHGFLKGIQMGTPKPTDPSSPQVSTNPALAKV